MCTSPICRGLLLLLVFLIWICISIYNGKAGGFEGEGDDIIDLSSPSLDESRLKEDEDGGRRSSSSRLGANGDWTGW